MQKKRKLIVNPLIYKKKSMEVSPLKKRGYRINRLTEVVPNYALQYTEQIKNLVRRPLYYDTIS